MVKSENASQRGNPARVAAELRSEAEGGATICTPGFAQYNREHGTAARSIVSDVTVDALRVSEVTYRILAAG
ncbi:MAG: hypothetical protein NVS9B2_07540 [Steroidobacteraceae bacterium]